MADTNLSFSRYVRITSGVIGGANTRQRDLIGRIFTSNPRCPTDVPIEFTTAQDVGRIFGFASEEYKRAQFYFSWVSLNVSRATKISFAKYNITAIAPRIFGVSDVSSVSDIVALGANTSLNITVGGENYSIQNIDMSADVSSYSDVATKIQSAINSQYSDVTMMADATVYYSPSDGAFNFVGGDTGDAQIDVSQTNLSDAIGWTSQANYVDGSRALQPAEAVTRFDTISNNYASVLFLDQLSMAQYKSISDTLNSISDVTYIHCVPVTQENAESWGAALAQVPGIALGLVSTLNLQGGQIQINNYTDMIPMVQVAATDYSRRNATSSFMYREFPVEPLVTDDQTANMLDANRVNYYGRTQTAGRNYSFYQRGVLCGPVQSPVDQNVYANEIWLKDYAATAFMDLLRGLPEIPADADGRAYGMNTLQGVVDMAIFNGVISVGKDLNDTQKAAVTNISGSDTAWRQVENIGYWMNVTVEEVDATSGITEYRLVYTLIYAKKDTIRSVSGTHALV